MSLETISVAEEHDRYALRFTFVEVLKWLARPLVRRVRGQQPRFYIRSPKFKRTQVVIDRGRSEKFRVSARDLIDVEVLGQVFGSEDYDLSKLARYPEINSWEKAQVSAGKSPLIVDLGANTGLASLYFARVHAEATIIAVEPDLNNAATARRNLTPYPNVCVVEGGIASADGRADIMNPGGGNWSYRTELSQVGAVPMYSMATLLAEKARPDSIPFMVKIDIEGFESDLFTTKTQWIDLFPVIVIELHDHMLPGSANSGNFLREVSRRNRDFVHFGENVFSISNDAWGEASVSASLSAL